MKRTLKSVFALVLSVLLFLIIVSQAALLRSLLLQTGILKEEIYIAGTGSMYPTFPKGEGENDVVRAQETVAWPLMRPYPTGFTLFNRVILGYNIQRGDIVSFSNKKTDEITEEHYSTSSGFVKRVIALPGDTIEIRDGFVKINGQILDEPYTAKARSTYGGTFLSDCQMLEIPEGKVFVMGDNRKESLDSRNDLELISFSDIDHVIPIEEQQGELTSKWRDTKDDATGANKPSLDGSTYLTLLNQKRKEAGLKSLTYNAKLEQSAIKRGQIMLQYNDLSFEATRSGYTMVRALADVGYSNIVRGEAPVLGFYDAQELVDGFFTFPDTKQFLLDSDYQETGIAVVVGTINNCPAQVIVQHLAGYLPPNYKREDIDAWKKLKSSLVEVLPSWERGREIPGFYDKNKDKLERLITVIRARIDHANAIIQRMEANQWLNAEEQKFVEEDPTLHTEQERLSTELNQN